MYTGNSGSRLPRERRGVVRAVFQLRIPEDSIEFNYSYNSKHSYTNNSKYSYIYIYIYIYTHEILGEGLN